MNAFKKFIFISLLFMGIAGFSFGETYFGTTAGYYHFSDEFLKENYGRNMNGSTFIFSYHNFPTVSPLGFLVRVAIGSFSEGLEWKNDTEISKIDTYSAWDLSFCFAPSYKLQLSERVKIPLSLGPVFSLSGEETNYYNYYNTDTLYYALSLGLLTDGAIMLCPSKYFFIMSGLSVGWNFLHLEQGIMSTQYREFRSARYKATPYMSGSLTAYLGVGVRFD